MKQNSIWEQAMRFDSSPEPMPQAGTSVMVVEPNFANHPKAVAAAEARDMITYGQVAGHPLVNLLNRIIPPGYGTYVVVLVWVAVNIASLFGYSIPGFAIAPGNEGALSLAGLALAYFRRAIGK